MNPTLDIGAHVRIKPLEDMPARVVEIAKTAEEGWIYVCRYFSNGEAKTMRCFPDEVYLDFAYATSDVYLNLITRPVGTPEAT